MLATLESGSKRSSALFDRVDRPAQFDSDLNNESNSLDNSPAIIFHFSSLELDFGHFPLRTYPNIQFPEMEMVKEAFTSARDAQVFSGNRLLFS